jgi:hypothetical protein
LVELLVALSAGVLVAMAAVLLARNASHFFQHEARIATAQLAVTLGMNRLTADLQRAGFLAARTHQLVPDPNLCDDGVALPTSIRQWRSVSISVGGSLAAHGADLAQGAKPENNLRPDSIIIGGSLATTERFTIKEMPAPGGANQVKLRTENDEAMGRLRAIAAKNTQDPVALQSLLRSIFASGRFLRVLDDTGKAMYAIINRVDVNGVAPLEDVTIELDPALRFPDRNQGATCGILAFGGYMASVVYRVRYDIRSLQGDPTYGPIVAFNPAIVAVSGENTRTELVRVELDANDNEIPGTLELVAELAVDLKFGITTSTPGFNPVLNTLPFDEAKVGTTPSELIRAVQVRLATRARVPDREAALSAGAQPYRFAVADGPLKPRFARLRSLHTNVSLPNHAGFTP